MKIQPFKLERFFDKYEFNVSYLLCSSDCESLSIQELLAYDPQAREQFERHWLGYTEYRGSPELRQAIAGLYTSILSEKTLVCAGAEEAIFIFMNVALEAGDHVIVHAPGYQSLHEVARAIGSDVSLWLTGDADHWELDLNWVVDQIRPNTRAIVVNCPHNPSGYLMSAEKQQALIDLVRQHNLILFSDEVYRGLEHQPGATLPAACDLYENAVSLGVLSKTYGLAGLRIGWMATHNRALLDAMATFKDYTSMCNSAPSEFLGIVALRHRQAIAERNLNIIRANLDRLDNFFATYADLFDWQRPRAGSTAFPRIKFEGGAEAFCTDLVNQRGTLLLPSTCYDFGDEHFRVGYGRKNLPEALTSLEAYVAGRFRK